MSSELAIKADALSKAYHIYNKPHERFLQMLNWRSRQYFQEFWALRDVSLEVRKGETVGIIGKNGSGKSTLLQIICGTLSPSAGQVRSQGKIAALLELGSGFNPEFTGRENVQMYASILGLSEQQIAQRYDDIVAFADIGEFLGQPVKTYSSGMVVRLAFAVIAHVDADILVIDEALAVGDAFFTQKCMRFLRRFREHGTLLFVSHDASSVVALCDKAIWLDGGKVRLAGEAKEVTSRYLEGLYDEAPGNAAGDAQTGQSDESPASVADVKSILVDYRDQRMDFINSSNLRNDIELFEFDDQAPAFGDEHARIISLDFVECGQKLNWVVGGESVTVRICCVARHALSSPIVGFFVKDRLGQRIFGENTYLTYRESPLSVEAGAGFAANFEFTMPLLPAGDYSIDVAIADGSQEDHRMLHWIYDALLFRAQSSMVCHGLFGVPMKSTHAQAGV